MKTKNDQQAELNDAFKKMFGKDLPNNNIVQQPQIPTILQANNAKIQPRNLNYFEYLSLILVGAKAAGLLACNWLIPFLPVAAPFIFYGVILLIGIIKNKFFN